MKHPLSELVRNPNRPRAGILHLGPGAFFRAHLADYTEQAIQATGGDWGIEAAGLRNSETARQFSAQDGCFSLLVRDGTDTTAKVLGSVLGGVATEDILARMNAPDLRIVTLTITEKAYGLDSMTGGLNFSDPAIVADLSGDTPPRSAVGLIAAGLAARRDSGRLPFTPLSCDNLSGNGALLRRLVLDFAAMRDPELAEWIATEVPFPNTMVDRITPATTKDTLDDARRLTGAEDLLAVETEPFRQWVIEDRFAQGRPDWDRAGALFVENVAPYEAMKLRMLNGTHSLIAWLGLAAGHEYVRDAIADPAISRAAQIHLSAAAETLEPVPGVDISAYAAALLERFRNQAIAHRLEQIAMDGTQKLPPRIFAPATELLKRGGDTDSFARVMAGWIWHAVQHDPLHDPRAEDIRACLVGIPRAPGAVTTALMGLPGLVPSPLREDPVWNRQVAEHVAFLCRGEK
ncbi:mannitol dehydrogenase family protein [Natronohydrobacter thiooxidans]|uniref:mannitol dehydrogenase family protein n=1 Tax=Natronohydrobacter thiooxidans TaxID=87172 RepID=UPI0008FF35B4|nr:mannitol dehydrogenase family protein [Natronohydrobacter thiooxidans]